MYIRIQYEIDSRIKRNSSHKYKRSYEPIFIYTSNKSELVSGITITAAASVVCGYYLQLDACFLPSRNIRWLQRLIFFLFVPSRWNCSLQWVPFRKYIYWPVCWCDDKFPASHHIPFGIVYMTWKSVFRSDTMPLDFFSAKNHLKHKIQESSFDNFSFQWRTIALQNDQHFWLSFSCVRCCEREKMFGTNGSNNTIK